MPQLAPGQQVVRPSITPPGFLAASPLDDSSLAIDELSKTAEPKVGDAATTFHFQLRNISTDNVVINDVHTSCGCTVAKLPSKPWIIAAGQTGELQLDVDLTGKSGTLVKTATVMTAKGTRVVTMVIKIPATPSSAENPMMRQVNLQVAQANRQAVFQGDCARCHAAPSARLLGEPLYHAACGICHEPEIRATMVPNLHTLAHPTDRDFWKTVIVAGKYGTLMPGFSREMGGPLTTPQIDSLVAFLTESFSPFHPAAAPAAAATAATAK
jgi:cytochrome c553